MKIDRKAGVLMHPTSLYGEHGIGDFGPACYEFIDFMHDCKQKLWQVLPLTPTSFGDSPYQSFSTFAGNYLLLSPEIMLQKKYITEQDLSNIPSFDDRKVEYAKVAEFKSDLFRRAYINFKRSAEYKKEFKDFCDANSNWLNDFCLFVALKNYFINARKNDIQVPEPIRKKLSVLPENLVKDYYYGAVWLTWPNELVKRNKNSLNKWTKNLCEDIEYNQFLQFEFFEQWTSVKKYANDRGISIIGDLPIFVALDSADVWANPDLFQLDYNYLPKVVAGVPPDYFSATGQLWGNPLYDWSANKKSGYNWWVKRIKKTCDCVNILRIDHFRGFESYWAVPFGSENAINGKWCEGPGKDFFDTVKKNLGCLPIIAEDLGIITEKVSQLRDICGLPGMRVLEFAFDGSKENNHMPHNFETANIVAYTGTHDNDTVVGWYNNAPEIEKDRFRRYMNVSGDDVSWDLIRLLYSSVAKYAIVPVQDLMCLDSNSRMNVPGKADGNWQFRFTKDMLCDDIKVQLGYLCDLFHR